MYSALDIANEYIALGNKTNIPITPLRLQKMLYFTQVFSFNSFEEGIIIEETEAWDKGPVYYDVYKKYECYGDNAITTYNKPMNLDYQTQRVLLDVFKKYATMPIGNLIDEIHAKGTPWDLSYNRNHKAYRTIIPKEYMKQYFNSLDYPCVLDVCNENKTVFVDENTIISKDEWDW